MYSKFTEDIQAKVVRSSAHANTCDTNHKRVARTLEDQIFSYKSGIETKLQ